jgi:hypothetical protein
MSVLPVGIGDSGSYQALRSLRLRASATAGALRTGVTPTERKKLTLSFFVKRSTSGVIQNIFQAGGLGGSVLHFGSDDKLHLSLTISAAETRVTSALFRDPTAVEHIQLVLDTTQATASDRVKLYRSGTQITSFTTSNDPALNAVFSLNDAVSYVLAQATSQVAGGFDGYLSEFYVVDGQALTPSVFGEFDSVVTTYWKPKSPVQVRAAVAVGGGTRNGFGANGGYWPFSDPTSLTTLMYDRSQSDTDTTGNNWTANNISLTAGSTYDSMIDVPLGGGGQERGNYATLNPLNFLATAPTNGNLRLNLPSGGAARNHGTIGISAGKWYFETRITAFNPAPYNGYMRIGITRTAVSSGTGYYTYVGSNDVSVAGYKSSAAGNVAYGANYTVGDVIGTAFDLDSGTITFYKNNVSQGVAYSGIIAGEYFAFIYNDGGASNPTTYDINFGQRPFTYTPPAGFKALHTGNLPTPTGAALEPKKHFDVLLHTGTGVARSVTGAQFQPDLVWVKARSAAFSHKLYDSVRGATKELSSDLTSAESTDAAQLTSFNSDGFSVGTGLGVNQNASAFADWLWKAGGAAVTNNAGSISSQVSANVAAGFSIVTYTGNGAVDATVGHGLGVAPAMIINKVRNNTAYWPTYHKSANASPASGCMNLQSTAAFLSTSTPWNNVAPSSSVFTVSNSGAGNGYDTSLSANNYVAYCFAEVPGYSKIGSYTGNGSVDGPFVYCGFMPRWVLFRQTNAAANWYIFDTARNTVNVVSNTLYPNLSNAETFSASYYMDYLSNGFKLRNTFAEFNGGTATYIFMAMAEAPFKYANAR